MQNRESKKTQKRNLVSERKMDGNGKKGSTQKHEKRASSQNCLGTTTGLGQTVRGDEKKIVREQRQAKRFKKENCYLFFCFKRCAASSPVA